MNDIEKIYNDIKKQKDLKPIVDSFNLNSPIEVLVFCYAYNHDKYISKCIESMLNQLVDFNVKIIIHNDNSNDKTKEIIESYQNKYKNVISVINQTKNLYLKEHGLLPIFSYLRKYHQGEYIAMCEGDDYWDNTLKLKTQVELLRRYKDCRFCVHKVNVLNNNNQQIVRAIPADSFKLKSCILNEKSFIKLTSIRYPFQTSSYMVRTKDFSNYIDNLPEFAKIMPTEDESILLFFGQLGKTIYIDKPFSCYRKFSEGSWSNEHRNNDAKQNIDRLGKMIKAINSFNGYTLKKFDKQCEYRTNKHRLRILLIENKYDDIFCDKKLKRFFRKQYPKDYLMLAIKRCFK